MPLCMRQKKKKVKVEMIELCFKRGMLLSYHVFAPDYFFLLSTRSCSWVDLCRREKLDFDIIRNFLGLFFISYFVQLSGIFIFQTKNWVFSVYTLGFWINFRVENLTA